MFQWVETNELEAWANLISAASNLPKWIRRLIYATSPDTPCTFPSDEDVRHKRWDGVSSSPGSLTWQPVHVGLIADLETGDYFA